ncbi:hypothetical protein ABZU76_49130 [Amycolatopsis sp. NPDC005232]|uniref:hypothetical protein n=1 Tax=Amycolatopsis sp. NPDC005232 TaxID=3157027 RepID=UPI0033A9F7E2
MSVASTSIQWLGPIAAGLLASASGQTVATIVFACVIAALAIATHFSGGLRALTRAASSPPNNAEWSNPVFRLTHLVLGPLSALHTADTVMGLLGPRSSCPDDGRTDVTWPPSSLYSFALVHTALISAC